MSLTSWRRKSSNDWGRSDISSNEWRSTTLGEIFEFSSGLSKNTKEFGFGDPFLSFKTIFYNYFIPNKIEDLANSNKKEQEKYSIKKGDVFLTRTSETLDDLGMSCVALDDYPKATFNGFTKRLRPKNVKEIDPKYVGYYFRSRRFRDTVTSMASISTRASLNNEILSRLQITIPPMVVQKEIGNILYSLDDKIELNNRINKTLENMAQAIFKSWFVDFEPFQDGEFDDSELGRIPRGWRVGIIDEVCTNIFSGGTPSTKKSNFWNGNLNWLSSGETKNPLIIDTEKTISEEAVLNSSTRLANKHDVVIASAGQGNTRGQTSLCLVDTYINQSVISLRANGYDVSYPYLYYNLRNRYEELRKISDSSSIRGSLTTKMLKALRIVIPSSECIQNYSAICSEMIEMSYLSALQNKKLTLIRDTLLPKLMSGEIRIPIEDVQ